MLEKKIVQWNYYQYGDAKETVRSLKKTYSEFYLPKKAEVIFNKKSKNVKKVKIYIKPKGNCSATPSPRKINA
jgi:hypothetical protein